MVVNAFTITYKLQRKIKKNKMSPSLKLLTLFVRNQVPVSLKLLKLDLSRNSSSLKTNMSLRAIMQMEKLVEREINLSLLNQVMVQTIAIPSDNKPIKVCYLYTKKKLIFKKKYLQDNARMEKRNTKNIAKNFCKAFINYLQEKKNIAALIKAKQLMSYYNYNNKTIQALGKDQQTSHQFRQFLKSRASQWVQSSKIYDKKIHKQAIPLYLSLIQNQNSNGTNLNNLLNHQGEIYSFYGNFKQGKDNASNDRNNPKNGMINQIQNQAPSNSVYESDQLFDEQFEDNNKNQTD